MADSASIVHVVRGRVGELTATLVECARCDGWRARIIHTGDGGSLPADRPQRPSPARLLEAVCARPRQTVRSVRPRAGPPHRVLRALVSESAPHLIELPSSAVATDWISLGSRLGARLVVNVSSDEAAGALEQPREHRSVWRAADLLVLESEQLADLLRDLGVAREKLVVIPPAVERGLPEQSAPRAPGEPLRLLSVGVLSWTQGYEHVIEAARLLRERGAACRYRIVGCGPLRDAVVLAIHQLGLEDCVELAEADSVAASEHVRWADLLVGGGLVTPSPQAVIDAHAVGVPVIRSDLEPGEPEAAAALVPEPLDPSALAEAVLAIDRDEQLRERLVSAGRRRAVTAPTLAQRARRLHDLHRDLLGVR